MTGGSPVLKPETYDGLPNVRGGAMTLGGAMFKTAVLLALAFIAASYTWRMVGDAATEAQRAATMPIFWGGMLGGLAIAIVTMVKKEWSPVTAPLYAIVKGLFLGVLSALYNSAYDGIVVQAITLTFGTALLMLALYVFRIIVPTAKFKAVVLSATGAIFLIYLVSIVLRLFGVHVPYIHDSGAFGIGFSVFVVVIAALNLIIDYELIEEGALRGAPKYMEWFGGFAVLVTLIWLYIEILRLLAKLRRR